MARSRKVWIRLVLFVGLFFAAAVLLALAGVAFLPLQIDPLVSRANPIEDREEALTRIQEMRLAAPDNVLPECRGLVLDHGEKTQDVYVLLHGLTNCPEQFRELGELLFKNGANVLIPRTPYHGYQQDFMDNQKLLTGQSMLDTVDSAIDVAHAFGSRITLIGLSVNGTTAAWMAQNRDDIDRVVLLAPFFAPHGLSDPWIVPAARVIYRLPNRLVWWDPIRRENLERPEHSYPMFATHPIAHVLRIGVEALRAAAQSPPLADRILVVTSAADTAVNNNVARELVELWAGQAPGRVKHFEFPAGQNVPHDMIDPRQPSQRIDLVYPKLIELIGEMQD